MKILLYLFLFLVPFSFGLAHEEESATLIAITKNGFEPSTLSIAPHTKVVFINRDSEGHWPASDRHPTHSDYGGTNLETHCSDSYDGPEPFDSCRALEQGETWSFIFEEAGVFNYHDHVWSHLGGTITVVDSRPKMRIEIWAASLVEWVRSFFVFDIEQFETELEALVESEDPRVAIELLRDKSSKKPEVATICHDLVHEIGRTSFSRYQSLEKALTFQNSFCSSGYIHGVFEEYFISNEISSSTLSTLCDDIPRPFDAWQCNHGIGHALMYQSGGDINKTVETCSKSLNREAALPCFNGAYMELFNSEVMLHEASSINPENPFEVCSSMTIKPNDCYLYSPTYFTLNLNWSYEDTMEKCLELEGSPRLSCINGTASEATNRTQHNLKEVFTLCNRFEPSEELSACIRGASTITVFVTASIDEALKACDNAGKYAERCRMVVKEYQPMFVTPY